MLFDIGVYLVVVGAVTSIALALEERDVDLMEAVFAAILVGLFFAAAIYLMLSKFSIRIHASASRSSAMPSTSCSSPPAGMTRDVPPVIPQGESTLDLADVIANPLPQALILTAIVISFSFLAVHAGSDLSRLSGPRDGQYRRHARWPNRTSGPCRRWDTDRAMATDRHSRRSLCRADGGDPCRSATGWSSCRSPTACICLGAILMMLRRSARNAHARIAIRCLAGAGADLDGRPAVTRSRLMAD
jgi:multicomponent Na+:H+ antiporter subunit C